MRPPRLPPPPSKATYKTELWIDEAIWGHRLYDEQTPWMIVLEMLGVLVTRVGLEPFCEQPEHAGLLYKPVRRLALRMMMFNAPFTDDVARRYDGAEAWTQWLARMQEEARRLGLPPDLEDFSWLRAVFEARGPEKGTFRAFAEVLRLLRTTAIEGDSNKRWTSRFAFPYGPAALYPDLRWKHDGGFDMDRRFFARTGELLYLMLCRSGRGATLYEALRPVVLDEASPWNRLLVALQPPASVLALDVYDNKGPIGFLPYPHLPDYTALASDLIDLLALKLPGYDALPHLVDLVGLHLVLYLLRRAAEWAPDAGPVQLVMEIVAPRRTTVRDLAVKSFADNSALSTAAVDGYLSEVVGRDPDWLEVKNIDDPLLRRGEMQSVLERLVFLDPDEVPERADPEAVLQDLRDRAKKRHGQHIGSTHAAWAQAIGLASRRGTRKMRYAPGDQLLKTLVFTVVKDRMEFQEFLDALWQRYHLVIGHRQAEPLVKRGLGDQKDFEENAHRLEMRLASLGLLRRLSDACAYVENPMGGAR